MLRNQTEVETLDRNRDHRIQATCRPYTGLASRGGRATSRVTGSPEHAPVVTRNIPDQDENGHSLLRGNACRLPTASVRNAMKSFFASASRAPSMTLTSRLMTFVPPAFPPW